MRMHALLLAALSLVLTALPSLAQGDRPGSVQSLEDAGSIAVDAVVEGPGALAAHEAVRTEALIRRSRERLQSHGVPTVATAQDAPTLHIHLNMMEAQNGLVAFSVELEFFQEVDLVRTRHRIRAATWNESVVGLVSRDMMPIIAESLDGLIEQFARDFNSAN